MACELHECCQLFKDSMADFPQAAEYIRNKLCFGDHERCTRYAIYKEGGIGGLASFYHAGDEEQIAKSAECLRQKKRTAGDMAAKPVPQGTERSR